MRRVYSCLRPPIEQKSYVNWITRRDQKLSLSSRGLLAFTSSFSLNQRRPNSTSHHVYIVDINTPYQPYKICESGYEYSVIEWDPTGTKLLTSDVHGCVVIYSSRDYLISSWKPYFTQVFPAETFIASAWYHPGLVSCINVANRNLKTPSNHLEYSDKIQQTKFGASLRLFGGKAAEGCILVSKTGLICCLSLLTDGSVNVITESLGPIRVNIAVADICHCKDGSFVIGASAGSINSTISFHRVNLLSKSITLDEVDLSTGSEGKRIAASVKQFHSFHPNIMTQIFNDSDTATSFERVAHIRFVSKDSPDDLLIEVSGTNLSLIELWQLQVKKKVPVHSTIVDITSMEPNNVQIEDSIKEWTFKGNYITDKELATIQVPRFKMFGQDGQLNIILLAYKDSTICCMRTEDLQPINESLNLSSDSDGRLDTDSSIYQSFPNKNVKVNAKPNLSKSTGQSFITDVQLSSNQTIFVAIDSMSQVHVARLPTLVPCQESKDENTYLQYLLEYSLVTGNDWWDVMICIPENSIESICEHFHDAFERQPKHIQKKYYNRQLMIRASLYRCLNTKASLCKASDCHTMMMLNSTANTLKSTLRSQDQDSPADFLSNLLKTQGTQPNLFNYNEVVTKIKESEFYVETNLIQCFQPSNQWIADLATYLVVSLPHQVQKVQGFMPGESLISSREVLETLRELLVIIKIWGLQNEASMPVFHRLNEQTDVLGSLFRILSICYANVGKQISEFCTADVIAECNHLANSILIPHFSFSLEPIGIASPVFFSANNASNRQLTLQYFKQPTQPTLERLASFDGAIKMTGDRKIDVVRNISLGADPVANIRQCTRCVSVSLIKPSYPTTRAWEQRWISNCICGGFWAQAHKSSVSKVSSLTRMPNNQTVASLNHSHQLVW